MLLSSTVQGQSCLNNTQSQVLIKRLWRWASKRSLTYPRFCKRRNIGLAKKLVWVFVPSYGKTPKNFLGNSVLQRRVVTWNQKFKFNSGLRHWLCDIRSQRPSRSRLWLYCCEIETRTAAVLMKLMIQHLCRVYTCDFI